jgi:hypothetical protein
MSRHKFLAQTWAEAKVYASGVGLRELAPNMKIPEGTMLSRAKREGWTQQIATAKVTARPDLARELVKPDAVNAITPMQSAATTMMQRGQRHVERIAGVTEKVLPHLEAMQQGAILEGIHEVEKFDRMARRNFGLSDASSPSGSLNINVLAGQVTIQLFPGYRALRTCRLLGKSDDIWCGFVRIATQHARLTTSTIFPRKIAFSEGADDGSRTHTSISRKRILSPLRLPFRHIGG